MIKKSIDITRNQSLIMRGVAIMSIAIHNYCHMLEFTVHENESSFSKELAIKFFDKSMEFSNEWIYNIFSFLGWYGVPVFIFLTGFGLVRKYDGKGAKPMVKHIFLYDNWFKLMALMLPGVLYYICNDIIYYLYCGNISYITDIYRRLFLLTLLNDILGPWKEIDPGVYWYFGLTLEFYILYAFFVYKRNICLLIALTLGSVILQFAIQKGACGYSNAMLWWIRQNITGWMVPFTFGILYARTKKIYRTWVYMIVIAAAILFFPAMMDPGLWQVSLLCAIVLFIVAASLSLKIPYWRSIWIYIGKVSPFIFAAHPIVRGIFFVYLTPVHKPNGLLFISYIFSVMICAILYKTLWNYLTPKLRCGMSKIITFFNAPH